MGHLYAAAGDVGFTQGTDWLQRTIRWAERTKDEPPSWANHTLLFTNPGIVGPLGKEGYAIPEHKQARCVEALWHVKHHHWFKAHRKESGYRIKVYRPTWLSVNEKEIVVDNALRHVGARYGWWKLLFHLGRKVTGLPLPNVLHIDSRPICSYLVADAFDEAGWPDAFGTTIPPQAQDPDDQHDFCEWASYQGAKWKYVGETRIP